MIKIKLDLKAAQTAIEARGETIARVVKSPKFLQPFGVLLVSEAQRVIKSGEVRPLLSESYRRKKVKQGFSANPLLRTIGWRSLGSEVLGNELFISMPRHMSVHQFGFEGSVSVSAHRRQVKSRNVLGATTAKGRRKKFGGQASGVGFVKAHTRKVKLPARPFLGILSPFAQQQAVTIAARAIENS